ncbi:hypothetical protein DPMN_122393 [Dreissena polymorpha]|uniref:Uncharacterized protein n=1 Tax=Dreissena polymorpha TaxID=45954 RepID=A0A9D4GSG7_DREPO|nr:hypothetical protein DPMN_122393 [Dreissena polymorpha]
MDGQTIRRSERIGRRTMSHQEKTSPAQDTDKLLRNKSRSQTSSTSTQRTKLELAKLQLEYEKRQADIKLQELRLQENILKEELNLRMEETKL